MTLREIWEHPAVRWIERAIWAGLAVFLLVRLWPQVASLTGLPPAVAAVGSTPAWSAPVLSESSRARSGTASPDSVLHSDSLRGRVVVVNFWATWCPPCRLEMPALQRLWDEHRDEGLVVVGLSGDAGGPGVVRAFLEERDITYPVAMATPELRDAFGGIPGYPTTFLVDRSGAVRNRVFGYFVPPAMKAAVARLLDEDRP